MIEQNKIHILVLKKGIHEPSSSLPRSDANSGLSALTLGRNPVREPAGWSQGVSLTVAVPLKRKSEKGYSASVHSTARSEMPERQRQSRSQRVMWESKDGIWRFWIKVWYSPVLSIQSSLTKCIPSRYCAQSTGNTNRNKTQALTCKKLKSSYW